MRRLVRIAALLGVVGVSAGAIMWWRAQRERQARERVLHGNVDLRQVQLAFNNSERSVPGWAAAGRRGHRRQVLARLDKSRLEPQVRQAEAEAAAQQHVVERLKNGSRPEEIAQARAQVEAQRQAVDRLKHGSRPEEIEQARANVQSAT